MVFVYGRFFRDYRNLEKYQDRIRSHFTPQMQLQKKIDLYYQKATSGADMIAGVHIRRGDYAQFAGGKYFYSHEEYGKKMSELQSAIPGKKITFVLCSDEYLDINYFPTVSAMKGSDHVVEDLYLLAKCDYIMGRPSTFALWASFYGGKPLCQIRDLNQRMAFGQFSILPLEVLYNFSFN